jgi:gas vesicle protein
MARKNKNGFYVFLLGGAIGAAIGLLFAPRSGEETRQLIKDESEDVVKKAVTSIQKAQDKAMTTMQEVQTRLETLNQETKERLGKLQEIAKNTMEEQKESLGKGYSNVKEVVAE